MFAWLKPDKIQEFFQQRFGYPYQQAERHEIRSALQQKFECLTDTMSTLESSYKETLAHPGGGRFRVVHDSASDGRPAHYWVVRIGGRHGIVMNPLEYFYLRERTDFADTDIALLQARAAGASETGLTAAPAGISMSSLREEQHLANEKIRAAEADLEAIRKGTHSAMAEVKKQMEEAERAMQAKRDELNAIMEAKKAELEKMLTECNQKVFKLESLIFNIQSYLGETYEVYHLRQGRPASASTPLVIGQKLRFLDEDLPMLVGLYGIDLVDGQTKSFADALTHSDMLVDYFTLSERSITCFRLSRSLNMKLGHGARVAQDKYGFYHHWIESIEGPYGNDAMGFIIKDGENLYLTMVDDADKLFVDDDLFLDIKGPEGTKSTNPRHILARRFMFSTIQGFIDSKKMLTFEAEANIFRMTSNIILSAATSRLQDTRFGTFKDLKVKLNAMTRADDDVYVIDICNDPDRVWGSVPNHSNHRSEKGLTQINSIRYQRGKKATFVSVERDTWRDGGTRVNFQIEPDEYINVTYLNTVWVNYYIVNKMEDSSSRGGRPFGLFVKDLLVIRDFLSRREEKELELIRKEYVDIESVKDWPLRLSEWKLQQKIPVREITEYQAKRFAKSLREGAVKPLDFLYKPGSLPVVVDKIDVDWASSLAEMDRKNRRYSDKSRWTNTFYTDTEFEDADSDAPFSSKFQERTNQINLRNFAAAQEAISELETRFGVSLMNRVKAIRNLLDDFGSPEAIMSEEYDASKVIKLIVEDDTLLRRYNLKQVWEKDRFHFHSYPPAQKEADTKKMNVWKGNPDHWVAKIKIGDNYCDQIRSYRKDKTRPILIDNVTNLMVSAYLTIVDQLNSFPSTHLAAGNFDSR